MSRIKCLAALLLLCFMNLQLALTCPPKPAAPDVRKHLVMSNATTWHGPVSDPSNDLAKRWLSLPETPTTGGLQEPYSYPWPPQCRAEVTLRTIRYCFKDERSATNLLPVLRGSIVKWFPAMQNPSGRVSSLWIEPDPGCPRDNSGQVKSDCLCTSPGVSRDALVISDETKDGDSDWNDGPNCQTSTTVGYQYIPAEEPDNPWRHRMRFCGYEPSDRRRSLQRAIRTMTHELGHAMGLKHEHQRPDRDQYIKFRCRYVVGWRAVRERVDVDEFGMFEEMEMEDASREEKMAQICSSWLLASKYLPDMSEFLRTDQFDFNGDSFWKLMNERVEWSEDFDYDSIMIYDSTFGSLDRKPEHYTIKHKDGNALTMGGSKSDPKITEGDIARIAMLYPIDTEQNRLARAGRSGQDWTAAEPLARKSTDYSGGNDGEDDEGRGDAQMEVRSTASIKNMTIRIGTSAPMVVTPPRPLRRIVKA